MHNLFKRVAYLINKAKGRYRPCAKKPFVHRRHTQNYCHIRNQRCFARVSIIYVNQMFQFFIILQFLLCLCNATFNAIYEQAMLLNRFAVDNGETIE